MYHSIIVGFGLAGLCYAFQLKTRNKPFLIINHPSIKGASLVSSGLCNPFNFKRYTLAWRAPEFFYSAKEFFQNFQKQIEAPIIQYRPIYKPLNSASELNQWQIQCQQAFYNLFFDSQIQRNYHTTDSSEIGYGVVHHIFQIDLNLILKKFIQTLNPSSFIEEKFDYSQLTTDNSKVKYKQRTSQYIVFCQGYALKSNPLTQYLPLDGNKGERLIIASDTIPQDKILKSKVYVIPQFQNNQFWIGATFDRHSKTSQTTIKAKQQLIDNLNQSIGVDYQIVSHHAQIRPTVRDRRPLLGRIPNHSRAYVLNGLGTRGILLAPLLSKWLYQYIEKQKEIPQEVSINRFNHLYHTE